MKSSRLAAATMLAWLLALGVWVLPFIVYGLPAEQVQHIVYRERFFLLIYGLLVVSLISCMAPRTVRAWRRCFRLPSREGTPKAGEGLVKVTSRFDAESAQRVLAASGFRTAVVGEGWVWAVRNRFSPLASVVFHFGIVVLIAVAAWDVVDPGFSGTAVVAEGETFTGAPESYANEIPPEARVPNVAFRLDRVRAEFFEDVLLFTRLDALLSAAGKPRSMSLASPWLVSPDTMVALEDFGYAVQTSVVSRTGQPGDRQVHKLKVFPSGATDTFRLSATDDAARRDYEVEVTVFGDYTDLDGRPASASFNLANPKALVDVRRVLSTGQQSTLVDDMLVASGQSIRVLGDSLTIEGVRRYGVFRVTNRPAVPALLNTLFVLACAVAVRLLLPRSEALLIGGEGGATSVSVRRDTYGPDVPKAEHIGLLLAGGQR